MSFLPDFKICTKCGQKKSMKEFDLCFKSPNGLHSYCKSCCIFAGKPNRRNHALQYNYGINEAQYELMLKAQNDVCAICKQPETAIKQGNIKKLAVDHCHKTRKIRGLLCNKCNTGLGGFKDNLELLEKAAQYLRDHSSKLV